MVGEGGGITENIGLLEAPNLGWFQDFPIRTIHPEDEPIGAAPPSYLVNWGYR